MRRQGRERERGGGRGRENKTTNFHQKVIEKVEGKENVEGKVLKYVKVHIY